jgi:hypothetical protein
LQNSALDLDPTKTNVAEGSKPIPRNLTLHLNFKTSCPPKILLMGDSVDRHLVEDFCISKSGSSEAVHNWSYKMFGYRTHALGAALCNLTEGIVGHLHFFGSNASGPYLHNLSSTIEDPFIDTEARICKGIEVYSRNVAVPTLIAFQVLLWDVYIYARIPVADNVKAQRYKESMFARVKDIQACKHKLSTLMLRTVPAMLWNNNLVVLFNGVMKSIARDLGIRILDYDSMLWGMDRNMTREQTLFRDQMHPRREFNSIFASHLISIGNDHCMSIPADSILQDSWSVFFEVVTSLK